MPVIDRIKISQEINFNGMPTWIGIEGTLLPDEDTIEGLRTIQKKITEYQDEEQKAYTQSKWGKQETAHGEIDTEFEGIKNSVILSEYKEDAIEIINNSGNWKIPLEFQTREIVKNKPSKIN